MITAEEIFECVSREGAERALQVWTMRSDLGVDSEREGMARALMAYEEFLESLPEFEQRRLFNARKALVRRIIASRFRQPQPPAPPRWISK